MWHSSRGYFCYFISVLCFGSYLASGASPAKMADYWMIGKSTAYDIVKETCEVILNRLQSTHLAPQSKEQWRSIAEGYWKRWNLPNCCGALDGKHIRIQCPINSGSQFFNYKQYFSLVLMALCDSNYCFTWVEVGDFGKRYVTSLYTFSWVLWALFLN